MASLSELLNPTAMDVDHDYATLPSTGEDRGGEEYDGMGTSRRGGDAPLHLAGGAAEHLLLKEVGTSLRIQNLDAWFTSLYTYFKEKGFACIVTSRVVNLLTLGFTIFFSGFLLLYVDWTYLRTECAEKGSECDILRDSTYASPLRHRSALTNLVVVVYLILFSLYWTWSLVRLAMDLRPLLEMRAFCNHKLQLSDRDIQTITWPEVVARVVHLQATTRVSIVKDLSEHDIVARILRKENYMMGMLNRGVLGLSLDVPGLKGYTWLTKCVEWNIDWAVFNGMFDDDFSIRASFYDVAALRLRMRYLAVANMLLSPFLAIFMVMYFLLHNAEKFYHQPSSVGHRQWSTHAWWRLREFNELSHFTEHRLAAAHKPATRYVAQFPSPVVSMVAKFVSYIVGAFAAIAIACALIDDRLLHAEVFGRDLLWFTAVMGTVLAASRGMIGEENRVFEPNKLMGEVVAHTHYLPRHWRNLAHNQEVQAEFEGMFQFKAGLFLQEMLSIFAVPFILWYPMCQSAPEIVQFVRQFTVHRPGVGHICSLSAFDFRKHGNSKYGAPVNARKAARSKQGKMEKSFLSFHAHYPTWEPDASGREMLSSLAGFRSSMHGTNAAAAATAAVATAAGVMSQHRGGGGGIGGRSGAVGGGGGMDGGSSQRFAPPGSASMFFDDGTTTTTGGGGAGGVGGMVSVGVGVGGGVGSRVGLGPGASSAVRFRGGTTAAGSSSHHGGHHQPTTNHGLFGHGGGGGGGNTTNVLTGSLHIYDDDVGAPADERVETESQVLLQQYYEWYNGSTTAGTGTGMETGHAEELEQADGGDGDGANRGLGGRGGVNSKTMATSTLLPMSTAPLAAPPAPPAPAAASPQTSPPLTSPFVTTSTGAASPAAPVMMTPRPDLLTPDVTPAPDPAPSTASQLLTGVAASSGDPLSSPLNNQAGGGNGLGDDDEDGGRFDDPPELWRLETQGVGGRTGNGGNGKQHQDRAPGDVFG